ncbi:MAG TPA: hypothetical protein VFI28_01995, partial [Candidatus Limnocylindrales bacterium]|nr:hypothetical protein [Candidatus Limnocylindrales bacterium]
MSPVGDAPAEPDATAEPDAPDEAATLGALEAEPPELAAGDGAALPEQAARTMVAAATRAAQGLLIGVGRRRIVVIFCSLCPARGPR